MHASGFRIGTAVVYDFGIHFFHPSSVCWNIKKETQEKKQTSKTHAVIPTTIQNERCLQSDHIAIFANKIFIILVLNF